MFLFQDTDNIVTDDRAVVIHAHADHLVEILRQDNSRDSVVAAYLKTAFPVRAYLFQEMLEFHAHISPLEVTGQVFENFLESFIAERTVDDIPNTSGP